jgi:hypothetical protein
LSRRGEARGETDSVLDVDGDDAVVGSSEEVVHRETLGRAVVVPSALYGISMVLAS